MSRFLVFAKPDAVERQLVGKIISRFEKRGFLLESIRSVRPSLSQIEAHYAEHRDKSFYPGLVRSLEGRVIIPMIWKGNIETARNSVVGSTCPWVASPGTIRGDFANSIPNNLVHCSDSEESANREINIWFNN